MIQKNAFEHTTVFTGVSGSRLCNCRRSLFEYGSVPKLKAFARVCVFVQVACFAASAYTLVQFSIVPDVAEPGSYCKAIRLSNTILSGEMSVLGLILLATTLPTHYMISREELVSVFGVIHRVLTTEAEVLEVVIIKDYVDTIRHALAGTVALCCIYSITALLSFRNPTYGDPCIMLHLEPALITAGVTYCVLISLAIHRFRDLGMLRDGNKRLLQYVNLDTEIQKFVFMLAFALLFCVVFQVGFYANRAIPPLEK